ncbi:MAG: hypothetical protein IPL92_13640 [Saprospiraceae bacterium]|nr:hypothetical protein [Candidatus Opimibacter iunctus]
MNYQTVTDKKELIELFLGITQAILEHDIRPILHLDLHGDENGFELNPSKEFVSWKDFCDALIPINVACKNSLIIFMNVCKGFYNALYSMESVLAEKPSPFFMCIGPHHQVMNIETRDAYQQFYKHLFETKNFSESYLLLNSKTKTHDIFLADNMTLRIAAHIKSTIFSPGYKIKAASELEALFNKGNKTFRASNFNQSLKLYLHAKRQESIRILIKMAESFLMIDRFPELKEKFQIEGRILEHFSKNP